MTGVSKRFGGVRALDKVDLRVRRGEIHALLGENGAGKSTILKILSGVHAPTTRARSSRRRAADRAQPGGARRAGVAMIFQEMSLVPTLTVAQNIFLTREARDRLGLIDDREAERRARELFAELGVDIDPRRRVSELPRRPRQLTEIVKAISQRASVLILDEPTHGALAATRSSACSTSWPASRPRASRSSTSRTGWTRSSRSPTARRSCATGSTSSPRRCPSSRWSR